jgi:hypothetical protein
MSMLLFSKGMFLREELMYTVIIIDSKNNLKVNGKGWWKSWRKTVKRQ